MIPQLLLFIMLWNAPVIAQQNIVVLLVDDMTLNAFNQMPYLQSRARGSWVTFDNAFLSTALCAPSRATLLTGRYAHTVNVFNNETAKDLDPSETLGVWMQRAGYRTAWYGKYLNGYGLNGWLSVPPGWNDWKVMSGDYSYFGGQFNVNGTIVSVGAATYNTDLLNTYALEFLTSPTQPFFLVIGYYATHNPHTPAKRHRSISMPPQFILPNVNEADVSDKPAWIKSLAVLSTDHSLQVTNEARTALAVDESIHNIMDLLYTRGVLDNTVIIFTSDNGYSHGSHRFVGKWTVYDETVRTPLMIRFPGAIQHNESKFVSNVDWNPTIMELSGATAALPSHGRSLVPLLNSENPFWRHEILICNANKKNIKQSPPFWAVFTDSSWKYSELVFGGEKELYDLIADRWEMNNLANDPAYIAIQADLAAQLAALKAQ